jgi:hypothetical protein
LWAVLLANTDSHGNGQHDSVTNSDVITYINCDSDCDSNAQCDSNANRNAKTFTDAEICANAKAAFYAATAPVTCL